MEQELEWEQEHCMNACLLRAGFERSRPWSFSGDECISRSGRWKVSYGGIRRLSLSFGLQVGGQDEISSHYSIRIDSNGCNLCLGGMVCSERQEHGEDTY